MYMPACTLLGSRRCESLRTPEADGILMNDSLKKNAVSDVMARFIMCIVLCMCCEVRSGVMFPLDSWRMSKFI